MLNLLFHSTFSICLARFHSSTVDRQCLIDWSKTGFFAYVHEKRVFIWNKKKNIMLKDKIYEVNSFLRWNHNGTQLAFSFGREPGKVKIYDMVKEKVKNCFIKLIE